MDRKLGERPLCDQRRSEVLGTLPPIGLDGMNFAIKLTFKKILKIFEALKKF